MNFKEVSQKIIGNGLPLIGNLLGGDLGEKVGERIASVVGCEATPEAIDQAIQDPEKLIQLKKYEMDHKIELENLQLKEIEAYLGDVKDARNRDTEQVKITGKRDPFLMILASALVLGYYTFLAALFMVVIPAENRDIITMTYGALLGSFGTVIAFYFGSSKSSGDKTKIIANQGK